MTQMTDNFSRDTRYEGRWRCSLMSPLYMVAMWSPYGRNVIAIRRNTTYVGGASRLIITRAVAPVWVVGLGIPGLAALEAEYGRVQ